jgi:hypothetical protein
MKDSRAKAPPCRNANLEFRSRQNYYYKLKHVQNFKTTGKKNSAKAIAEIEVI